MPFQFFLLSWRVYQSLSLVAREKLSAEDVKGRVQDNVRKTNRKCHTCGLLIWILTKDERELILYFIPGSLSRLRTNCRLLLRRPLMVFVDGPTTSSANYWPVFSHSLFGSRLLWTEDLTCQLLLHWKAKPSQTVFQVFKVPKCR